MKFLAMSDIHGRADRLEKALNELKSKSSEYQFVFLGNYIDIGTDSKECIDLLIDFQSKRPESKFLLGNHEEFLLYCIDTSFVRDEFITREQQSDILRLWMSSGGEETLKSYNITKDKIIIPENHLNFIKSLEYIYQQRRIIFVHAGIDKTKPLNKNTISDLLWSKPPFGYVYENQRLLVHGHTKIKKVSLDTVEMRININTGCGYESGKLSVLEIDESQKILGIHTYK